MTLSDHGHGTVYGTAGIKTPNLSRLERQKNMKVDTLRNVVAALGGKLEIVARFKDEAVTILSPA